MKLLKINHLDYLFDISEFGPRVIFEHHLLVWQEKLNSAIETVREPIVPSTSRAVSEPIENEPSTNITTYLNNNINNVNNILKNSTNGKVILDFFQQKRYIENIHRDNICSIRFLIIASHPSNKFE